MVKNKRSRCWWLKTALLFRTAITKVLAADEHGVK